MTDSVNLLDLPTQLGSALGISPFAAGILVSLVVALIGILAVLILTKGKGVSVALIIGVVALGFCCAISWFPSWFFIILILMTAAGLAAKFKDMI